MALTGNATATLQASPGISPYPPMTMACWLKMPPTGTGTNYCFILQGSSPGTNFAFHYTGTPTPNGVGMNCAEAISGKTIDASGPSNLANTPWHFLLATFDTGGVTAQCTTVTVYIDGALYVQTGVGGPVPNFSSNDAVSSDKLFSGSNDGGGSIDYPMIWKRMVTAGEIAALNANGDPRVVAPSQLVSFVSLSHTSVIPDLVTPSIQWTVTAGTFSVVAPPFPIGNMPSGNLPNPPKLRSYVEHKPHSSADNKPKWGRTFDTYFNHFPVDQTDIFFKPNRPYINSYVDHFARSGDLRDM